MTFYDQLVRDTAAERDALYAVPLIADAAAGTVSRESYIAYLQEAYHHVKHTVPLMMACGARLREDQEWLREAIAEYIENWSSYISPDSLSEWQQGRRKWILDDVSCLD